MSIIPRVVGLLPQSWIKLASRAQWKHPLLKRGFDLCAERFRNQDGVIQQGVGKGVRFNTGGTNAGFMLGTSEPGVQEVLRSFVKAGMTVFDVGANVGFLSVIAARLVGTNGRVVCFEPLPGNVERIEHNKRLNEFSQISVKQMALGAVNGEASFIVSDEPTWGKLASAGSSVVGKVGEISVAVRRLDDIIADDDLPLPDLIKIDVEGAEAEVLAGATETLRLARPLLLIELHGTNIAVAEALKAYNYRAVVMGSRMRVEESPWDAYVIAAPSERADEVRMVEGLSSSIAVSR